LWTLKLDLVALKKMRAQFEVRPLDPNARDMFPDEAIQCSSAAIDMLNVLHGEAEDVRNTCESCMSGRKTFVRLLILQQCCLPVQCTHGMCLFGGTTLKPKMNNSPLYSPLIRWCTTFQTHLGHQFLVSDDVTSAVSPST
jgi:hypothetical protein